MQKIFRMYSFLIVCSVVGFHKVFLKLVFRGLVLMDWVTCLKYFLILDYELFVIFKQVSKFLGVFLLFGFGMNFLYSSIRISRVLVLFLNNDFCSKLWKRKKLNTDTDCDDDDDDKFSIDNDENDENDDEDECNVDEDFESDVSKLRKMVKIERRKANLALSELAKERLASSSAADEAMSMILRLQNEKSSIELELSQYKRLAEEKQIHDQGVIQSLQWLVCKHEYERSLLEEQLKRCRRRSKDGCEEVEEDESCFNGNILDALENVLYSSRDDELLSD